MVAKRFESVVVGKVGRKCLDFAAEKAPAAGVGPGGRANWCNQRRCKTIILQRTLWLINIGFVAVLAVAEGCQSFEIVGRTEQQAAAEIDTLLIAEVALAGCAVHIVAAEIIAAGIQFEQQLVLDDRPGNIARQLDIVIFGDAHLGPAGEFIGRLAGDKADRAGKGTATK